MILIQDEVGKQVRFPKFKDRVKETVREQSELLKGLKEANRVYISREELQTYVVDELNKISQRHQVMDFFSLKVGHDAVICSGCANKILILLNSECEIYFPHGLKMHRKVSDHCLQ